MITTDAPTYDQVAQLAERLSPTDKERLRNTLTSQLQHADPPTDGMTLAEAKAVFENIRDFVRTLPQPRPTAGEQLEADRAARQASIEGRDVHP